MQIQQIRNATLRLRFGGATFLIDPWLAEQGAMGTFAQTPYRCMRPEAERIPMPMLPLPCSVAAICSGIDAIVLTHVHPDHIDMAEDGTVGKPLPKEVPLFVQNVDDAVTCQRSGFDDVTVLYENSAFGGVSLIKTPARHGTKIPCGSACGVVFQAEGEKTLYLVGDSIWYEGVRQTLERFHPAVIVVNACGAHLLSYGRLIMDAQDIALLHAACPDATIVISHMDCVAHATVTRSAMRAFLDEHALTKYCVMPEDGASLDL
ncbi:MAG: MBL fold metallo-hydrolase [Desulfovibrio sp.]|nr:MBL fold metallo-hydrolase [Desulfovibrio sp.]